MLLNVTALEGHHGRIKVLHKINIQIDEGEIVALVGANGAGKTTLLRIISGLHRASGGSIEFAGQDVTARLACRRVKGGVAHVPEGREVFGPMTVEDNLRLGGHTRPVREIAAKIEQAYVMFPILAERRRQLAGTLSGGEQQMLAIGRALMSGPRLLLLDEPSMGLSPFLVNEILAAVASLRRQGMTVLLVEQNANAALGLADRGYVMETGRIDLADSAANLLANQRVREAYLGF